MLLLLANVQESLAAIESPSAEDKVKDMWDRQEREEEERRQRECEREEKV